jgi:hypothetical protein
MAQDYSVQAPRLDTEISETGTGFTKVWEVPYTVTAGPAKGTRGSIRVPASEYNADNVHAAIAQAVQVHHEVMGR